MTSLRLRLTCTLLAAVVAVVSLAMIAVYLNARQEVDEMFDFEIRAVARSYESATISSLAARVPDDEVLVQLWSSDGDLQFTSNANQRVPHAEKAEYSVLSSPEGAFRIYTRPIGSATIQVTQSLATRRSLAVEYSLRLLAPLLFALPILGVLVWWVTKNTLKPVNRLGTVLAMRTATALDPVETRLLPDELVPLVDGFNRLLERLRAAFDVQRALVSDAAHELRTPLAVVQVQAQTLQRMTGPGPYSAAIAALLSGVQRATRVVQQLLTLAKNDSTHGHSVIETVELTELVRQTLAELVPLAAEKRIELSFEAIEGINFPCERGAIQALVANLVDNAIKYTPDGGRVIVTLTGDPAKIRLRVMDSGPGIPVEQRILVLDRFYRLPGSTGEGSGLGLSIASAVVRRHSGQLALLTAESGGLCVEVAFPSS